MKWKIDKTNILKEYFNELIDKYFSYLKDINIIYAWGKGKKIQDDSNLVLGETYKVSNLNRDLFGCDFIIVIYKEYWDSMDEKTKYKLAYHELCHCGVRLDDNNNIMRDNEDREKVYLKDHDIDLQRFKSELIEFGLDNHEKKMLKFLKKVNLKFGDKNES